MHYVKEENLAFHYSKVGPSGRSSKGTRTMLSWFVYSYDTMLKSENPVIQLNVHQNSSTSGDKWLDQNVSRDLASPYQSASLIIRIFNLI